MIELRDYQNDAVSAVLSARGKGITRALVALPTGTGKTLIFAEVAKRINTRTLILAHRDELIRQAVDKVSMVWPEADIGVIKAGENETKRQVVVASVQTLSRQNRLDQVVNEGFAFCTVDECHHTAAETYQHILEQLSFLNDDPGQLLLGVTATARRGDKIGLGHIFQDIVYQASILTMVRAGYLSDLRGVRVTTNTDILGVATRQGDFVESQLSLAVNTPGRNQAIVEAYLEHAAGRKALAFTVDVQHAKDLASAFKKDGIEAKALSGKTPEEERREALRAFTAGEIQIITNCALLTEGYDEPSIACILMARPTKSATLYTQCVGRGTRLYPGKQDCLILDFADNRHDVCALPTLLGFDPEKLTGGQSARETLAEDERMKTKRVVTQIVPEYTATDFDLLGKSMFRWIQAGRQWRLPVAPGVYVILQPAGDKYQIILTTKDKPSVSLHPRALDMGYAQGVAEDYARRHGKAFSRRDAAWRNLPATEKQLALLKKLGLPGLFLSKGQASDMLEEFFANKSQKSRGLTLPVGSPLGGSQAQLSLFAPGASREERGKQ